MFGVKVHITAVSCNIFDFFESANTFHANNSKHGRALTQTYVKPKIFLPLGFVSVFLFSFSVVPTLRLGSCCLVGCISIWGGDLREGDLRSMRNDFHIQAI